MIKILFVCHGNICRSPMSEYVLKDMVEKLHMEDQFEIASAATSTEEIWGSVGNPVYPPAQAELRRRGIGGTEYTDFSGKRAVQVTRADYEHYDYILCADTMNIRNTTRITGPDTQNKIHLLLDFADADACIRAESCGEEIPGSGRSIADPWYTGNFVSTYNDIVEGCTGFLKYLKYKNGQRRP